MPHPPRQIAEALETDSYDSPPADLSSTGPSDMEHSSLSSQEDEVFSDESLQSRRDRYCGGNSSFLGRYSSRSSRQVSSPSRAHNADNYQQLAASRSSLDDSALQLAAERHDDLICSWEAGEGDGYSTGSLRSRRSLKMRNLMEMFEKGSVSSEDSSLDVGVKVKGKEVSSRSESTSGSTTLSLGSQDRGDPDTDDEMFPPPYPRLPSSLLASRRSRSRERAARSDNQPHASSATHRRPSQSPTFRRPSSGRGEDSAILRRRRPSPVNRVYSLEERNRGEDRGRRLETAVGQGRPPRYRSSSRSRAYSDSSTSESDNTLCLESGGLGLDSPSRPRGLPRSGGPGRSEVSAGSRLHDSERANSGGEKDQDSERERDGVQRRGSIKELRQLFEKSPVKDESKDSGSELSPPVPVRRSIRTRSVSPADNGTSVPSIMRRSLEIPTSSLLKQRDMNLTSQPLRLGPKPFYGSKK